MSIKFKYSPGPYSPTWNAEVIPEGEKYVLLCDLVMRANSVAERCRLPQHFCFALAFPYFSIDLFVSKDEAQLSCHPIGSTKWRRRLNTLMGNDETSVLAYFNFTSPPFLGAPKYEASYRGVLSISKSVAHGPIGVIGEYDQLMSFQRTWGHILGATSSSARPLTPDDPHIRLDSPTFYKEITTALANLTKLYEPIPPDDALINLVIDKIIHTAPDMDRYPANECAVCYEPYEGPRVLLDCSHRICISCLRSLKRSGNPNSHRCPHCRSEILVIPRVVLK